MKMRHDLIFLFLTCIVAVLAVTWDVRSEYSITDNPNGVWRYGVYTSGTSFAYASSSNNFWKYGGNIALWKNTNSYTDFGITAGSVSLECDYVTPVARFVAPYDGNYYF